jgi:hypothetical protein
MTSYDDGASEADARGTNATLGGWFPVKLVLLELAGFWRVGSRREVLVQS